jgi:hypothetical protein
LASRSGHMRPVWVLLFLGALVVPWAAPAQADWRRAESPNFVVYSSESEARLREHVLLLEDFDQLLRTVTTAGREPTSTKLHVYILRGARDLKKLVSADTDVAGFYLATTEGIAAFVDARSFMDRQEILLHEYVHHFMYQHARDSFPPWYVEGIAEYYQTTKFDDRRIEIGRHSMHRSAYVVDRDWLPMERVLFGRAQGLDRDQAARFYAQSWLAVHYFVSDAERNAALVRYFEALRRGEDRREAFEAEIGLTPEAFERELKEYVANRRITVWHAPRASVAAPPPVTITVLPPAARDLMVYAAGLRVGFPEERQEEHLEAVRKAAQRHGQDAFARRVLAHAETLYGDLEAADRLLAGLIAEMPDDAELMYLKGRRHLRAAQEGDDWEAESRLARQWFVRAHQADEDHFQTLFFYTRTLRGEDEHYEAYRDAYYSENTANVLRLAHQLAPQVWAISGATSAVLMRLGHYDEVESVVMQIATNPHDAEWAEWARDRIERARARAAADPTTQK